MNTQTIISTRLLSHQLTAPASRTPRYIVARMGAVQAQDFSMAQWAIGLRAGCTKNSVEEAYNRGDMLRTHVLRPTWHLVTPENIRWMLALSSAHIKSSTRSRDVDLEITEALYDKSNAVIAKALEGNKQLTRDELTVELKRAGIAVNTARVVHFLMRAEADSLICSGAMRGKTHTYALLDERVPETSPLDADEALARLAQIYFGSHAPATIHDFVWWSGLPITKARTAIDAAKAHLIPESIDDQTYYFANPPEHIPINDESVHLLPAYDEYIIAYRDRRCILPAAERHKAISSNGVFRPVILHNGQIVGTWKKGCTKKTSVRPDFFDQSVPLDKAIDAFDAFENNQPG